MGDARRTKSELIAEVDALRKQVAALSAARDVDELKRALGELRERDARHRRLTEHALDLIAEVDEDGRFLYISPNCEAVLGYRSEDLVGRNFRDSLIFENIHSADRAPLFDAFLATVARHGEGRVEYRFRRADGAWRWFESTGRMYRTTEGERRAVTVSRDVTERVRAQLELRQSEKRYRILAETTHDMVAELDAEGRVVFISPSCQEVLGYRPKQLIGTTPFGLLHPDDVERLAQRFLERLTSEQSRERGEIFRVRHRDGSWRWLEGGGVNFETLDGEIHIVSVSRDITDRIRAEEGRRKLEERIQQTQKLESLGAMAGGIAHDFNNLLTPILGDASLALMDLPRDSPARARLEKIQKVAHQAAALTHQMLDYAGMGSLHSEPLDVTSLVREMERLLDGTVARKARLAYELHPDLPGVEADATQLRQVLLNLVANGAEAMRAGHGAASRIVIRSGALEIDADVLGKLLLGESRPGGAYVYLEVEDTGCGMDALTLARVFDPFFTTKFTGRGLGLAAVLGIIRGHGGAIEVDSEPDRGTRIRVLLPAADPPLQPASEPRPDRWRGSATVLVADDDEGVRELTAETLARAGLEVLCAADGREAVEAFREHADEIGVVVLDRTMPGASGEEAFEEIRRIRADARIILVSGYSRDSSAQRLSSTPLASFLQKPFLPETLVDRVRQLLGD